MATEWIVALVTLTAMEIVLGIDNIIFIAVVAGRLPPEQQDKARKLGLAVALITRLLLLLGLSSLIKYGTETLFRLTDLGVPESWLSKGENGGPWLSKETNEITLRDVILFAGGLFLIGKSTAEIHHKLEGPGHDEQGGQAHPTFRSTIIQIALLDIVFSLDSVITAIGMARDLWVMVVAVVLAVGVMLFFAKTISDFVARHPTLKVLALSFLILIGVMLVADGLGQHIPKGYIYFAMAFSVVVEMLNLRLRSKQAPVQLHGERLPEDGAKPAERPGG